MFFSFDDIDVWKNSTWKNRYEIFFRWTPGINMHRADGICLSYDNNFITEDSPTLSDFSFFHKSGVTVFPSPVTATQLARLTCQSLDRKDKETYLVLGQTLMRDLEKHVVIPNHRRVGSALVIFPWLNNTLREKCIMDYFVWDGCKEGCVLYRWEK